MRNVDVVTEGGSWGGSFRVVPNISNFYCGVLETLLYCKVPLIDLRQLNLKGRGVKLVPFAKGIRPLAGKTRAPPGGRPGARVENGPLAAVGVAAAPPGEACPFFWETKVRRVVS